MTGDVVVKAEFADMHFEGKRRSQEPRNVGGFYILER